jgi:glutamine cyclotransferase
MIPRRFEIFPFRDKEAFTLERLPVLIQLAGMLLLAMVVTSTVAGQSTRKSPKVSPPPVYTYKVVHIYPHDSRAFTQGLTYLNGFLYEGTGQNGRSSLRKVRLETGEVLQKVDLPPEYFGEGIAIMKNEIVQLTWQSQKGFVYNLSDFRLLREFSYPGEGWGLATYGRDFLMSDGTSEIRVLDGSTLREKRRIKVHDGNVPVVWLNELEMVEGQIFANVWQTNRIARISPQSGKVLGWIDLQGLLSPMYRLGPDAVLNGIAYDPGGKRLFVTGKLWPSLFEIQLLPKQPVPGYSVPHER